MHCSILRKSKAKTLAKFLYFAFAVSADFAEWPLKVRVAENSPSLCPTMFSVQYTGMNLRPLWTAMV